MIEIKGISKNFGPVRALKSVNLTIDEGKILALVGENGAGKSTLMKILSGVYSSQEYSGDIFVDQKNVKFSSPKDSETVGICLIHQELSSFPHLTVAENMSVGHWPTKHGTLDQEKMFKIADEWLAKLGADFSSSVTMASLSTGQKQVVEIAKALAKKSKYIILDEPTSSLTSKETLKLFQLLKELKKQGCGLVYISHRMEEIFELSDRITVLRDGESVFTTETAAVTEADLITHMVGRSLSQAFPTPSARTFSEIILQLKDFKAVNKITGKTFGPLNLTLHKGEIIGFGGLLGAGRTELLQALLGDEDYFTSGEVNFCGKKTKNFHQLKQAYANQFAFVSEDRKERSILPSRSLNENASILRLSLKNYATLLKDKDETNKTDVDLKSLKTKFHLSSQLITELSGGNQQKVIFARALQNNPKLIILDEPTRGVDVGAKLEIYQLLYEWAANGLAILMISSDLPELMNMSDRIFVAAQGKIQKEFIRGEYKQDQIMKAALA